MDHFSISKWKGPHTNKKKIEKPKKTNTYRTVWMRMDRKTVPIIRDIVKTGSHRIDKSVEWFHRNGTRT